MNCPQPYQEYEYNEEWSFKDFTGRTGLEVPNDIVIYRSCFSNETLDAKVFPDDMKGVTIIYSNLDNVFIPDGNTVIDCTQNRFKVQNDKEDWILDGTDKPLEPVNKKLFEKLGLSIDPLDLPETPLEKAATQK